MTAKERLRTNSVAGMIVLLLMLSGCQGIKQSTSGTGDITSVNHIIFMAQENRSFDNYFGQLPALLGGQWLSVPAIRRPARQRLQPEL